jgi:hypothetical protein
MSLAPALASVAAQETLTEGQERVLRLAVAASAVVLAGVIALTQMLNLTNLGLACAG